MTALVFVLDIDSDLMYTGRDITINGVFVAHRPYDGSGHEGVSREVNEAFAAVLRDKLVEIYPGYLREKPEDEW